MLGPFSEGQFFGRSLGKFRAANRRAVFSLESLESKSMLSISPSGIELSIVAKDATTEQIEQAELAQAILFNHADTAYLQEGLNGLQLVGVESSIEGTVTQFQQTYSGLPVFNAIVTVVEDSHGSLEAIYNHGRPDLQAISIGPALDSQSAAAFAEIEFDGNVASESNEVWFSSGRDVRLAWQVNTFAEGSNGSSGLGDYLTIVDALAGDVLSQEKMSVDYFDQFASDTGVFSRIVINNAIGAAGSRAYAAPFDAVVALSQGCTGTLISPTVVVSARHCGSGSSVRFGDTSSSVLTVNVASVSFPAGGGSLLDGGDVSIITLQQAVPASIATPMRLIEEGDSLEGQVAVTLGYGFNGLGSSGHGFSSDGWRWGGENIIDVYGSPASASGSNIFSTDFDNGTSGANTIGGSDPNGLEFEATTAPGDSGGPLLVQSSSGEYVIAGVLSGGTSSTSVYGDISWWTGVGPYRNQIEAAGGEFLGGGLGVVSFDQGTYSVDDTVTVTIRDPNAMEPLAVTLTSDSGDSETLVLSSIGGNQYSATIATTGGAISNEDGQLQVALFDDIQVTYQDPDDGQGNPNTVTDVATIANVEHYVSSDIPVAIQDLQTVTSTIDITDEGTIVDLNVQINISHSWDEDLDVFLVSPDGTRVELFSDVGGNGNGFNDTILDDEADDSIASGGAPFSGSFRPEGSLSDFDSLSITGTWTLEIFDDFNQDQGTLNDWCLFVSAEGTDIIDGDFNDDGAFDCLDIDALTATIAAGTNDATFDLTGDGLVNLDDRDAWLAEAALVNLGSSSPYLLGDANLDGIVDGSDFIVWNANKFTNNASWCSGDFNADGLVDGGDFIIWNVNKFQSVDSVRGIASSVSVEQANSADRRPELMVTVSHDLPATQAIAVAPTPIQTTRPDSFRRELTVRATDQVMEDLAATIHEDHFAMLG